ncbi:hypothetical protein [Limnochorda pilosa]|uniref:Alkaline phosphatase family protein n=1 Tax=Limnochorda pilosa TaxID=1555112 RepID=A0A0K2SQN6_LIMPI|nr:hypothetical protein [Limnochorda pilosa]BAS29440.1 hypothetical protein LIP_3632 [Limnochorda pilosa]
MVRGAPGKTRGRALLRLALLSGSILWAFAGLQASAKAQLSPPGEPRLLLVLADGLGWNDLGPAPGETLGAFRSRPAVGLVTAGPRDPSDPWSRYLSLGVGRRTVFPRGSLPPVVSPETRVEKREARELWHSLMGRQVPDTAGMLLLMPPVEPPAPTLGDALREAGVSLTLIGGGSPAGEGPPAAALLAGSDRIVRGVVIPEPLQEDAAWPGVERTDWARLDALVAGAWDADLLVVEWRDLQRLERWESLVPAARYRSQRAEALAGAVAWMGHVAARLPESSPLLILSPAPPRSAPARAPAPLILIAETGPGLVTSGSTRRPGLLDPGDLAPSLLHLLGAAGDWQGTGRPLQVVPSPDPFAALDRFYRTALGVSQLRRPVLHTYIVLFAGMVLAAAVLAALAPDVSPSHPVRRVLDFGILMAASAPLAMLGPPLFTNDGWVHLVLVVLFSGSIAWILWSRVQALWRFPVLAGATFAALAVDVAAGAPLGLHAFLGNDPLGGARYYGVGNEYMGVLVGSALVAVGALWEWQRAPLSRLAGAAGLAALVVVLGHPGLGANVGGTLAALVGSAYLGLRLRGRPPRWSELLLVGTGALGLLAAAGVVEVLAVPSPARSHLGQLVARMLQEGWGPFVETARRKLATNLKLVEYTLWSRVLIVTLLAFVLLLYRPVGLFRRVMDQRPMLGRGVEAALVAALTALVVNDSGVLAAATAMIPTMSTLLQALRETRAPSE